MQVGTQTSGDGLGWYWEQAQALLLTLYVEQLRGDSEQEWWSVERTVERNETEAPTPTFLPKVQKGGTPQVRTYALYQGSDFAYRVRKQMRTVREQMSVRSRIDF